MYASELGKSLTNLKDPGKSNVASVHKKLQCTKVSSSVESRGIEPTKSDPVSLRTSSGVPLSISYAIICSNLIRKGVKLGAC
jgi:hypothetical protein